jgi:hypothetical protein
MNNEAALKANRLGRYAAASDLPRFVPGYFLMKHTFFKDLATASPEQVRLSAQKMQRGQGSSARRASNDNTVHGGLSMLEGLHWRSIMRAPWDNWDRIFVQFQITRHAVIEVVFCSPRCDKIRSFTTGSCAVSAGRLLEQLIPSNNRSYPTTPPPSMTMSADAPAAAASNAEHADYQSLWANKYRGVRSLRADFACRN